MRRAALAAILAASGAAGCVGDDSSSAAPPAPDASVADATSPTADAAPDAPSRPPGCPDPGNDPPATLECTGLYSDIASKTVSADARPYAPANALWADGASKARWIALPAGATIDDTDPNEWKFPVGTRLWKELSLGGKRIETRYYGKVSATLWARATYRWSADETSTTRNAGGDQADVVLSNGKPYRIPTSTECDECHRGRTDRILGFEAVGLGLPGATGLTLAELAAENVLVPPPAHTSLAIADDAQGDVAPAIGWLHTNCGVPCHNANSNAVAYGTGFRMRLDPTLLDGAHPATSYDVYVTGVDRPAKTASALRIHAGAPDDSLLIKLAGTRTDNFTGQMPPLVSKVVDDADLAKVRAWITALPHAPPPDAGVDSGTDAGDDGGNGADAGPTRDAGPNDAAELDSSSDASGAGD